MLLVTGATGFVGTNIMKEVGKKRKDIRILDIDIGSAKRLYPKYETVRGDITKPETLKWVGKDVDIVIHLAGLVSYSKPRDVLFRVNTEGTKNVLETCKEADKLIFSSSVSVYGEIKGQADESYPRDPKTPYGESKRKAENLVRDSGLRNLIFRIAPIYGEGSPQWLKNLSLLEKGFPISRTENLTHVTHISNAVQAFMLGLKPKSEGIYNIADERPVKFVEFAETLVEMLGKEVKVLPYWFVSFLARFKGMKTYLDVLTMNRNYDIANAINELNYKPKLDFLGELEKMVEWYKNSKT
ncbi:MAG: NAD(P)-dependent oxidoreductase [Candidatus Aenigmarchaeota archaeon]|nr:NAD(P)-dependent oxidoreductase [Candidatus Aenigmarchaeota archaeon]